MASPTMASPSIDQVVRDSPQRNPPSKEDVSFSSSGRTAGGVEPASFYIESPKSVKEVESVALEVATLKQKPSIWSKNMFQVGHGI